MISGALEGTTCIDVSGHVAGPYASSLLGDLGCEVIKIELPNGGDTHRGRNPKYEGYGPSFRALLKALRLVKQNRQVAMDAMMKFSELDKDLAARTYDGMIGTYTTNGVVDEETQKNDLDIVRELRNVTKEVPIERAYDFSFAKKADSKLKQAGWKP